MKTLITALSLFTAILVQFTNLHAAYNSLGANVRNGNTEFAVWNPDKKSITVSYETTAKSGAFTTSPVLKAYSQSQLSQLNSSYPGVNPYTDIYGIQVSGNLNLCEYYFSVDEVQVRDPYAKMMAGKNATYQNVPTPPTSSPNAPMRNCVVIDSSQITSFDFSSRPKLNNATEAIVYEANIANYTSNPNSGIDAKYRGTFTGMTESGSNNGQSTGLKNIIELGITHIQIMPMFSFSYAGYSYNWGYNPLNYNVPQQKYSAYSENEYIQRINEVQTMTNTFHKKGIRVIMDVVYNHMYQGNYEQATPNSFPPYFSITPKYYLLNSNGTPNGEFTGCGNTVDTSNPMVSNMVCDSLDLWMGIYNVDGFRFDLMATYPYSAVSSWVKYLNSKYDSNGNNNYLYYGEPWPGDFDGKFAFSNSITYGTTPCTEYINDGNLQYGAGCFSGNYRTYLKQYMLNSKYNIGDINTGFLGSLRASQYLKTDSVPGAWQTWSYPYANMPAESVNLVSCHDGYTLWDYIVNTKDSSSASSSNQYFRQVDMFATGMLMTSQGIAFIQEGDEFLRSKYANCEDWSTADNSYNAALSVNQIDWSLKSQTDNNQVFQYYKKLISLRKNTPAFSISTGADIYNNIQTFYSGKTSSDTTQAGVFIGIINYNGNEYTIIYNSNSDYSYDLPSGSWKILSNITDGLPNLTGYPKSGTVFNAGDSVKCCGTSVTILQKVEPSEGTM